MKMLHTSQVTNFHLNNRGENRKVLLKTPEDPKAKSKVELYKEAQKKGDLDDHNKVLKNKSKRDLALKMLKGVSIPRVKDKHGNNIKQHFGIWKYFIDTTTMERKKFYISMQCQRFDGVQGVNIQKNETEKYISENTVRQNI